MKKTILATAVLLSGLSFGQIQWDATRFGVTGGVNYSRVRHAHNPSGPRITFNAGVLALIPVDDNDQFYLQPEVLYWGAGETGKDKAAKGMLGYDAVYANNYISVPIYVKGYFSEAESEFFGMAGPKFNFLLSQTVTNPSKPYYTVEGVSAYPGVNGKASGFNFALSFGLGYSYKRKLEIQATYDMGLSNTYKNLMNEPGSDPNISKRKTEHVLSAGISYIFD